jgi:hypothetical protein
MFRLSEAIFRLNMKECVYIYIYTYITIPKNYKVNIISHYEKDRVDLVLVTSNFCDF